MHARKTSPVVQRRDSAIEFGKDAWDDHAVPVDNSLRAASQALNTARSELVVAYRSAHIGTAKEQEQEYELALLSEEVLDIYNRLLMIMHTLNISHS